jgi:hypothetical protein
VAFLMRDVVRDAPADAARLGKPAGTDAEMERPSVVQVTDLDPTQANDRARETADAALDGVSPVEPPALGALLLVVGRLPAHRVGLVTAVGQELVEQVVV